MKYILFLLLVSTSVLSQDFAFDKEKGKAVPTYVGQIKVLKGKVFKKNDEGTEEIQIGERFKKNDVLITQDKSFAKVLIVDDTLISVGPKSEVKFEEFDFIEKDNRKMTLALIKGQLTGNVRNKAKPGDINFRTKSTTMGVRGTYILMNHQTLNSKDIAEYALLSGSAEVTDGKEGKHSLVKGDRIVIVHDAIKNISANEKLKLNDDELKRLNADETDEEKEFKPFLPYFVPEDASLHSPVYTLLKTQGEKSPASNGSREKREEKKPDWRENLQKLNEKLKENQNKQ